MGPTAANTPLATARRHRLLAAMAAAGIDEIVAYGNGWQGDYLRYVSDFGILEGHGVAVIAADGATELFLDSATDADGYSWSLPVVAETADDDLNDMNGFHVKPQHAFHALDTAHGGPVEEGNVGGGTGMICNEFKGGIGTSSRVLPARLGGYTVGVLVQCNYGRRSQLRIAGVPVGQEITDHTVRNEDIGSIIIWVLIANAPTARMRSTRTARSATESTRR